MKYSFSDTMKQAEKDYGLGKGEYFKVQDGDNKIRILSACVPHQGEYKGNPTFKFVCWVLDRRDSKIKLYFMPVTIMNAIGDLQLDSDYAFDEVPMPYDINIRTKNAGSKEVEYTVIPSPNRTELTGTELAELENKPSVDEVVEKLKEGQKSTPGASGEASESPSAAQPAASEAREVKVEDVPF